MQRLQVRSKTDTWRKGALIALVAVLSMSNACSQSTAPTETADDDDGNLGNGTPHCTEIKLAFSLHGITTSFVICGDSASGGCPGACDFDTSTGLGVCDMFDYVAFQRAFVEGSDCACDFAGGSGSACDIFDFLAFQAEFVSAFEK